MNAIFRMKWMYVVLALSTMYSCKQMPEMDLTTANLLPKPVSVTATGSSFELKSTTIITSENKELNEIGRFFAEEIQSATGFDLTIDEGDDASAGILLKIDAIGEDYGKEGYVLSIDEDLVTISANESVGILRGIQTLLQVLPDDIMADEKVEKQWYIPSGEIKDYPEYEYRGAMLDVARHFFSVAEVKRYIDLLSYYKINALHLHLSDDQGWRVEIKSWPNLTTHGGSLEVGGGKGGFYTQEEYKDLVAYAAKRHMIIVPEIDMPGHTNAALASYAELNCDGKATELYTGIEVGFSTLCTDKEITYKFVEDVVTEIVAMTPGPYFHIGGDESHVTPMEDYIPFINRAQEIVKAAGKHVIGWDEIAHADLIENAVVQFWAKEENAKKGIAQDAKVLMSPAKRTYLDMKYHKETPLGLHWAAYIELDAAYNWDPASYAEGINRSDILGIEAPLWSETITNLEELEFMAFPRVIGHAEIGWTRPSQRSWSDYIGRLKKHTERLKVMNVNYYNSELLSE